jgi:APA family basic amino acid/polyamine antiporter
MPAARPETPRRLTLLTGTMLVVASMIGTGVFTTTGFLIRDLSSTGAVLTAWIAGGLQALLGALCYAELGAALPRNGGEYQLLGRIYHPALGFVAGVTSLVVGFAAPIAACAIAFGQYAGRALPGAPPLPSALVLLVALAGLHAARIELGSRWQDGLTIAKLVLIAGFCAAGFAAMGEAPAEDPQATVAAVTRPAFAVGLVFVSFAYSGWNAAAYIAGELVDPARNLPRALFAGTALVALLYTALNVVFLSAAPAAELSGVVEVGHVAAVSLFGETAGRALSMLIALGLISTTGALIMTGARVAEEMGRDEPRLAFLGHRREGLGPARAVWLLTLVAAAMALTATFDALLSYVGVTLSLGTALTALGVLVLRRREPHLPRPYRCLGYPLTPLIFAASCAWIVAALVASQPVVGAAGAATVGGSFVIWALTRRPAAQDNG